MSDIEQRARAAAGNWMRFESFGWRTRPEDGENWTIVYTSNRDSGLLDQSNAAAIEKTLEPYMSGDDPDVVSERHGHWGVGYVDGYSIRVYRDGEITDAFRAWANITYALSHYHALDEDDYYKREYEATIENIKSGGYGIVSDSAPADWAEQVFSWFSYNDPSAVENSDDQGGYPSRRQMRTALSALGFLEPEE